MSKIFNVRDRQKSLGKATIEIAKPLGKGATATVYSAKFDKQRLAAKIFHEERAFPTAKILAMIETPPVKLLAGYDLNSLDSLAWPVAILSDQANKDIGFLMPLFGLQDTFPLDYYYDAILFKKLKLPNEAALTFKIEIAKNLSESISKLHEVGHHFIDMKPQNIRVRPGTHDVFLLDCDGYSISSSAGQRYPAELLSTDYISPEAFRGGSPPSVLDELQDRYALAVLLFQLLNRGTHPFQGIQRPGIPQIPTNDEKAARGLYPHGLTTHPDINPRPQSIHNFFSADLRKLFDRAFAGSPHLRPSASEWAVEFEKILSDRKIVRCSKHPNDVTHMRFRDIQCPACYIDSLPSIKVPSTVIPKQMAPELKVSVPNTGPAPQNNNKEFPIGFYIVIVIVLFFWAASVFDDRRRNQSNPLEQLPKTEPKVQPQSSSALDCTELLKDKASGQICKLYWDNSAPQCDQIIRDVFASRGLEISPQSDCGKSNRPIPQKAQLTPLQKLDEITNRAATVTRQTAPQLSDWVEANNTVLKQFRESSLDTLDTRPLFVGMSIRPYRSLKMSYSDTNCVLNFSEAGICQQESRGLRCDSTVLVPREPYRICLYSLSR